MDIKARLLTACQNKKVTFAAIAAELEIDQSAVSQWFRRGRIPAEHVLAVERLTGVPRGTIRPDIYPDAADRKLRANA